MPEPQIHRVRTKDVGGRLSVNFAVFRAGFAPNFSIFGSRFRDWRYNFFRHLPTFVAAQNKFSQTYYTRR